MKKYSKKILSILLSLVFVLTMTPALSVFAETGNLDVSKTVNWGVGTGGKTDYTKLSISVTSPLPAATEEYPDILFLGCTCNRHGLTSDIVNSSLNKCLYRGNVDFYIFSNNSIKRKASLTKGSALGDNAIKSDEMSNPTHSCLSGFMNQLYESLDLANGGANNKYEYIVMEFDSARIAADYTSNSHEEAIADALEWYYDNGRVIWITDTDTYNFYSNKPSKDYIYGDNQHKTLNSTQFKAMAAVISPSQYDSVSSSTTELNSIKQDHKGTYTNTNSVFSAIKTVIYTRLSVDMQDKIKVITGSKIDSAEAYYADDSEITSTTKWTKSSITPTIDTATRTVSFEEEDIDVKHKWVKLNISVSDSNKFISIAEVTSSGSGVYDVNPNDGPASVKARALTKNGNDLVQNEYAGTATASTNCHYYDVTTKVTNGTITENKKYANGETAVVEYSPKDGYKLKSVTVDGVSKDIETYPSSYTFTDIADKHSVEVEYELNKFNITYSGMEGASLGEGKTNPTTYTQDDTFTLNNPSKPGYDFAGWTGTDLSSASKTVSVAKGSKGDRAYTATWDEHTAVLTYDANGGVSSSVPYASDGQTMYYTQAATVDNTTIPTREGYVFKGWAESSTATTPDYTGGETIKNANVEPVADTLYAVWEYGQVLTKTVDKTAAAGGDVLTFTITITNKSKDTFTNYTVEDALSDDLVFESAEYGTTKIGKTDSQYDAQNHKLILTGLTIPAKSGDNDGVLTITVKAKVKGDLTEETSIKNTATGKDGNGKTIEGSTPDISLYPAWSVTYQYDSTNHSVPVNAEVPIDENKYSNISTETKTATVKTQTAVPGWEFSGWYTNNDFKEEHKAGATVVLSGNKTLYGYWTNKISPSKTAEKTEVVGGEELKYYVRVKNNSSLPVTGYTITDELEDRLIYKSSALTTDAETGSPGNTPTYNTTNKTVTATNVSIPADKTVTLEITVTVDPYLTAAMATTNLSNQAKVNANTGDTELTVNADPVTPKPKAVTVKYQYETPNTGDPLPKGLTAPADVTSKKYGDTYKTAARQTAQGWKFDGWYYYDATNTKVTLEDGADLVLSKANIKSLADSNEVVLHGLWSYAVTLTKTVNKTSDIKGGDYIEYIITASNGSPTAVTNYKIEDTLNENLTFDADKSSLTASAGETVGTIESSDTAKGVTITAAGVTIPANGSVVLKITAKVKSSITTGTTITNTAIGTPSNYDPDGNYEPKLTTPPVEITANPRAITVVYHYVESELEHYPAGAEVPVEESTYAYGSNYTPKGSSKENFDNKSSYSFSGWYQKYNTETKTLSDPVDTSKALTTENFDALANDNNTIDLYGNWSAVDSFGVDKDVKYNEDSVDGGEVLANNTVQYSISVKNENAAETRYVEIVDEMPDGLTPTNISDEGIYSGGKITWQLSIGPNETKTLSYNATVPADLEEPTEYTNLAYVNKVGASKEKLVDYEGPSSKPETPGEETAEFTGIPIMKIAVKKIWSDGWDDHDPVNVGLYKNDTTKVGDDYIVLSDDTVVEKILPAFEKNGLSGDYEAVDYTFREIVGASKASAGDVFPVIVDEKSASYKIGYADSYDVLAGFRTTVISNVYQITADDLKVGKSALNAEDAGVSTIDKGDKYNYKLTITNTRSDVGVKDVVLEDDVPAGLTIGEIDDENTNYEISVDGQKVTWKVKELAASGVETLVIPVTVADERDAAEFVNVAKLVSFGTTTIEENNPKSDPVKTKIRNFKVTKTWYEYDVEKKTADTEMTDLSEQPTVYVTLMRSANGGTPEAVGDAVALNKENSWTHKWTKLDMTDEAGNLYAYTVEEAAVDGYSTSIDYTASTEGFGNTSANVKNYQGSRTVSYAFKEDGGHPDGITPPVSETIPYNAKYDAADKPSKEGYTFDGWFTDPECTKKFEDGTRITKDTVLYGKWTAIEYKITYNLDGGEVKGGTNPATYTADDPKITLINPTKENYKLVGWNGTGLSAETLVVEIPHGSIGDRSYKAVWELLNDNIRYDKPKEGPYDPKNPQYTEPTMETYPRFTRLIVDPNAGIWQHDGTTYTGPVEFVLNHDIDVAKPYREHYVFLGWDRFILDEGATVKLVARWLPDEIGTKEDNPDKPDNIPDIYQKKVTFKIQHGEWEDATVEDIVVVVNLLDANGKLDPNGSATIKIPEGMRPDKGFSPENGEWDEEPVIVVSGSEDLVYLYSYKPEYVFKPVDGDTDETVKVEIGQKIRVNPNGGKWKHLGRTYRRTTTIVIEENTKIADATRKGYKFLGWSTSIGKDGIVTLTAQWKALGAKTGDDNDMNNYLFTGMFALIAAALLMIWRKRDGMGPNDGASLKLQLEGAKRPRAPKMRTVPQKMVKPEPVKTVQKENKNYMGWYNINDDYKIVEEEPVVEQKVEVEPELPGVIEGTEFIIRIKK